MDAGVTLTIAAQPRLWCGQRWMFGGNGSVVFSASADSTGMEVLPVWWKYLSTSDWAPAVQAAADACAQGSSPPGACTLLLMQPMTFGQASWGQGARAGRAAQKLGSTHSSAWKTGCHLPD